MEDPYEEEEDNMEVDQTLELGKLLFGTPELVSDNILKYLGAKELLSLRRVCKSTRSWISYSSRSAWKGCQLEICPDGDSWKTFEAAVESGLNVTEFYINNPGDEGIDIYNSFGLSAFINAFGPHIRKLKVRNFGSFESDREFDFFQSLTNLRELKIQLIDARNRWIPWDDTSPHSPVRFPANFKNLKMLKLGEVLTPTVRPLRLTNYHWELVNKCPQLEYLRIPVSSYDYPGYLGTRVNFYDGVMDYLKYQMEVGIVTLQTVDLKYVTYSEYDTVAADLALFAKFLCEKFDHRLQLRNVHAEQFLEATISNENCKYYNSLITSLTNVVPAVLQFQLLLLEKLCINSTQYSSLCDEYFIHTRPPWLNLKTISIVFDGGEEEILMPMSHFLFRDNNRSSVESLSIIYEEDVCTTPFASGPFISSRALVRNFDNIRVLEFERLTMRNRSFLRLWEGLKQLEDLTISDCPFFGNVALIGENPLEPTFLKLKKLWKLKLKLDKMPKLTDRAFRDVFCHMRIKEFYLCSFLPLEKVTEAGISSLLNGEFGKFIEKFPFHMWSLSSMSFLEFKNLGKQFRSIL